MITPDYARTMAAYNAEMNRRLYAAAAQLTDAQRKADCGAFWKSIHGTLVHILWGDGQWMSRFAGWDKPPAPIKGERGHDRRLCRLVRATRHGRCRHHSLGRRPRSGVARPGHDLVQRRGAARDAPTLRPSGHAFLQSPDHHRGQAHALLTAQGVSTGDTDLFVVVPAP
ncbi:MAG: DinB family protein [Pseudomonadota bacterium]